MNAIRPSFSFLYAASAALIASISITSSFVVPFASATYRPKDFDQDWEALLERDPKSGQRVELSFGKILQKSGATAVIMMGECTPCGLSRLEKFSASTWKHGPKIVIVSQSESGLRTLMGLFKHTQVVTAQGNEKDAIALNSFFLPRAYFLKDGVSILSVQSPEELVSRFVEGGLD